MFPRFGRATTGKGLVERFYSEACSVTIALPAGRLFAAVAADLIREELDDAVVNPVVVRFDDSFLALITKAQKALLLDCSPEQRVNFRRGFR